MSSSPVLLDTSALLALLFAEPGASVVSARTQASISAINLAEAGAKYAEAGKPSKRLEKELEDLKIEVLPFDAAQAILSGELRTVTRPLGLSLGDRCCLAAAIYHQLPVLTADKAWAELKLPVAIEVVR